MPHNLIALAEKRWINKDVTAVKSLFRTGDVRQSILAIENIFIM
jgi:hypothetical protein